MSSIARAPLVQLTLTRLREYGRQPEALFWTFFFPIVLAFGLGLAFSGGGEQVVNVAVEAGSGADVTARVLREADGVSGRILEPEAARRALRDGDVALIVDPTAGIAVLRYDPSRPESRMARLAVNDALQRAAGRTDPRPVDEAPLEEKGSRYIDFLIPGLIGLNLLGTGLWGVGHTVVRMRTGRLLKRLMATPMRRLDFLASFLLARLVFLAAELALLLVFAWLVFDVTVRGSLAALLLVAVVGSFAFAGVGLLVASRARTTETAMGLVNLVSIPMWILSGVFFSSDHFPALMQPFIAALPLTAVVDSLRAVMLDGAPLTATTGSLAVATVWGAGSFALALAVFRWR